MVIKSSELLSRAWESLRGRRSETPRNGKRKKFLSSLRVSGLFQTSCYCHPEVNWSNQIRLWYGSSTIFEKGFTFLVGSGFFAHSQVFHSLYYSWRKMRTTCNSCTPRLVLDRQDKLETDFYFQAMAVGSMQLMYIWQNKNLKKRSGYWY